MNSTTNDLVPASCDYCGRENPDRLATCIGCGAPLLAVPPPIDTEPKRKSMGLAVCLALIFGPLGLLYVRAWWPAFVMIMTAAAFTLAHHGGLWLTVGGRMIAAVWAYGVVAAQDEAGNPRRDLAPLLNEAARLESVDRSEAIAAYEEIGRLYPHTAASREAARNIQTLKGQV